MDYQKLSSDHLGESSADIRARVESARERQRVRFGVRSLETSRKQNRETLQSAITCNSDMCVAEVRKFCKLDESVRAGISSDHETGAHHHGLGEERHDSARASGGGLVRFAVVQS